MAYGSVVEAVLSYAQTRPQRLCVADRRNALTYGDMKAHLLYAAKALQDRGMAPGDRVLVECTQDVWFSVCCLAVQLAGGVFVPLEKGASAERWQTVLGETQAVLAIVKRSAALTGDTPTVKIEEIASGTLEGECSYPMPEAETVEEILYSTGTTGKTKGVAMTHRGTVAAAENIMAGSEARDGEVELITAPVSHSHGLRSHYATLLKGNTVVLVDGVTFAGVVFDLMDRYHVTCIDLVPAAMRMLLSVAADRLGGYRDVLDFIELGSAPMSEEDKQRLRELLPNTRLYNFYGSTEAGRSCVMDFNWYGKKVGSIGRPTVNSQILIVDDQHREMAVATKEAPGLLAVGGRMMMAGYWNQPELTAATLQDGLLYTTDLCYRDEDGFLYVAGRADDVINCGGIKIDPGEIEQAAMQAGSLTECACVGRPDDLAGQVPVLFAVFSGEKDEAALAAHLKSRLDGNKQPRAILALDALPRTYNGKLDRKELRRRAAEK